MRLFDGWPQGDFDAQLRRFLIASLAGFVLLISTSCRLPAGRELPDLGKVKPFSLTDHRGQAFHSKTLQGKVWVVDFIFTTCRDVCPRMTVEMRKLVEATAGLPDVHFVSISVDPEHDRPEVLRQYASSYGANLRRWSFLTGRREEIDYVMNTVFRLGTLSLDHSTRFVLVDKSGRIRGYYASLVPEEMAKLLEDIRALARQRG